MGGFNAGEGIIRGGLWDGRPPVFCCIGLGFAFGV